MMMVRDIYNSTVLGTANFAEELMRASSAREKSLIEQRSAGHGQSVWDYGNNEYREFLRYIGLSARGNRPF